MWSLKDQLVFLKRLSLLLNSGTPLTKSLRLIARSFNGKSASGTIEKLIVNVEQGQPLSFGLEQNKLVSLELCGIVSIGEKSGKLAASLTRCGEILERRDRLKKRMVTAGVYPVILLLTSAGVLGATLFWIIPKIAIPLQTMNAPLPILTRAVLLLSSSLREYWSAGLGLVVFLLIAAFGIFIQPKPRNLLNGWWFRIPLFGKIIRDYAASASMQSLAMLLQSGATLPFALRACALRLSHGKWTRIFEEAVIIVESGQKFSGALKGNACPDFVRDIITTGEESGNLPDALLLSSNWLEQEATDSLKRNLAFLEPCMLLVLGFMIALVAGAVLLPIYGFTNSLTR